MERNERMLAPLDQTSMIDPGVQAFPRDARLTSDSCLA